MSATLPTQNVPRPATEIIWSRGGQCFRRLVWKETSEAVGLWCLIESMALVSGYLIDCGTLDSISMPLMICHAAPAIFALLFGARAFAHEVEHGTWELLRSVGASARDVLGAKWLVGAVGSLSILSLNVSMTAAMHKSRLHIAQIGEPTLWYALIVLLTLAVSLNVSLRMRNEGSATAIATFLSLALWLPWAMCFDRFSWLTSNYRWTCNAVLSFVTVSLPLFWAAQLWTTRFKLLGTDNNGGSRRWWKAFWRMFWKDLLAARGFWLSVLAIGIVLDGLALSMFRDKASRDAWIVVVAVMLPWLHSLGCGAIAFALEREDGTQDWLRRMSAPSDAVLAAKVAVTQISIVTLSSLILFGSRCFVSRWDVLSNAQCLGLLLAVTVNGVVGLGASLLTRRVMPAMFLAFVGIIAIDWGVMTMVFAIGFNRFQFDLELLGGVLVWWPFIMLALLAVERKLAEHWLNERAWWRRSATAVATRPLAPSPPTTTFFERSSSPALKAFGRLLWREWMEANYWKWAIPCTLAPAMQGPFWKFRDYDSSLQMAAHVIGAAFSVTTLILCALPTLLGVWSFHHDQRQSLYRFLSDRGGSPHSIWLSKQSIWLPLIVAMTALADWLWEMEGHQRGQIPPVGAYMTFMLIVAIQNFASAQCLSQLIRSPLTSMFLAAVASLLLLGWMSVLDRVLAPWPYQLGAAAIMFFASWIHMRDWLEERWTWRAWGRLILAFTLPAAALVLTLESQGYSVCQTIRDLVIPKN